MTATLCGSEQLKPGPAHRAAPRRTAAARFSGVDLAIDVAPVEPVMAIGRLDHRHGRVLGGRHGEGAGQLAQEIMGHFVPCETVPRFLSDRLQHAAVDVVGRADAVAGALSEHRKTKKFGHLLGRGEALDRARAPSATPWM